MFTLLVYLALTFPSLSGRVLSVAGEPVAGAEVECWAPVVEGEQTLPAEAETDAAGRFRLLLRAGPQDLQVRAPGFLRAKLRAEAAAPGKPGAGLEIRLVPGATLAGRVLSEEDAPIAGAVVGVLGGAGFTPDATTDEQGRYRLEGIEPGERDAWVRLGEDQAKSQPVRIARGENRLDLRFPRHAVHGRVIARDGESLPGAKVVLQGQNKGRRSAVSGPDGGFAFQVVDGFYRLEVSREGYVPFHSARPLRVGGAPLDGVEVRLTPGTTLRGTVRGLPLAGRRVTVTTHNLETSASAAVDAQGRYRLAELAPGRWKVTAATGGQWVEKEVTLEEGREARLDLTLSPFWKVRGRVLDPEGSPVARAQVFLDSSQSSQNLLSGPDGAFACEVPDGTYEVTVLAEGYAVRRSPAALQVAGAPVEGLEVRLEAGATVSGRVLGLTSEELAETQVWAGDDLGTHSVAPGGDGTYEIHHVAPGDWTASALHGRDKVQAPLHLPPGVAWVTLDFTFNSARGDRTLSGRLSGGDPLASYAVEIAPLGTPAGVQIVDVDLDGFFRFTGLRAGRYQLQVIDGESILVGGKPVVERTLDLTEDRDLEIELPPPE